MKTLPTPSLLFVFACLVTGLVLYGCGGRADDDNDSPDDNIAGALALDWEDMATGPCDGDWCLSAGDIGDNANLRLTKSIYVVPEPVVDANIPFGEAVSSGWERRTFHYPEGRFNAESLAVHPDETIYVLTKESGMASLYKLPGPFDGRMALAAEKVGELDLNYESTDELATGADIHPNGKRLLVRTYDGAFEWRLPDDAASFDEIVGAERLRVPAADEPQGEAIAYDPVAGGYVHASEVSGSGDPPLFRIDCAAD